MASTFQRSITLFKKYHVPSFCKTLSTSTLKHSESKTSILKKLWDTGASPHTNAHSKTLTANPATYSLQVDKIKPECFSEYVDMTSDVHTRLSNDKEFPGILLGSWTTLYGELDQAYHLWVYQDGYKGASKEYEYFQQNKAMKDFLQQKGKLLRSRSNQLCHEFSFWGEPQPRQPKHIYEIRSYSLKPGTLIEWGNNWGRAIKIRRKDAVGGFFSQVGPLYQVHHIWAYNDLQHRKEERELMWQAPGWDDCVAATVPLVGHMDARILVPTPNSPMQ